MKPSLMLNPSLTMPITIHPGFGRCIYCLQTVDSRLLTDEHVIPLALNGSLIIKKAACEPCRDQTNKGYENAVLQGELLNPRVILGLRRRKNKTIKYTHPIAESSVPFSYEKAPEPNVYRNGDEADKTFMLMTWAAPSILRQVEADGFEDMQFAFINLGGPSHRSKRYNFQQIPFNPSIYSLFLIKIAYGFAVSQLGLDGFNSEIARDFLKNLRHEGYKLVGRAEYPKNLSGKWLHRLSLRIQEGWIIVTVHIFASAMGARYDVIVGRKFDKI